MFDVRLCLKQLCDACNSHNLDQIMSHFADDCVLEMPRGIGLGVAIRLSNGGATRGPSFRRSLWVFHD